jgi:tetratricopeptide (TPR) repeat protein
LEFLREALEVLDPVANPLETANAITTEARFHHLAGRHTKAIELLKKAAELVRPTAESTTVDTFAAPIITQIYGWSAGAHQHSGLYSDADKWAQCAVDFGTRHEIPFAKAIGYEYLGENAMHAGNYEAGLKWAELELEMAQKLHSRERATWMYFFSAQCRFALRQFERSEQDFLEGMRIAELIGENRAMPLLQANYAVLLAKTGRYDEALETAKQNLEQPGSFGLLYSRFETLRCLAEVHFRRSLNEASKGEALQQANNELSSSELNEAERLCGEAAALIEPTESRVCQLWLGPLYLEVLLEQKKRAETRNDAALAEQKGSEAKARLQEYQELVLKCQSPRFTAEAERLAGLLANQLKVAQ